MSRRRRAEKREVALDPKYDSMLVAYFINRVMKRGKKSLAEDIVYDAIEQAGQKAQQDPLGLFKKAVNNVKPSVEVKSRRVGGANYQIPIEVQPERRTTLAIRWIIAAAKSRKEKSMAGKLAMEFVSAANKEGSAVKKKEDTHRMAEANRAFAHFKWR